MSTGCKSSHNGFLDVSRSNGGLRISGWIGQLSCLTIFSTSLSVAAFVLMHQDLTPKQRRKRKELVEELKASQSQKEQNLIIVKDKIVTNSIFQSLCASFVPTRATCYRYGLMTKDISYSRPYASYI